MKITDMLITTLLKHGVFGEMKGFKTEVLIPNQENEGKPITIVISAESLKISVEKD